MSVTETPTVVQALSAVMGEVQAVGKNGVNSQQGYKFRGVDAVVNAVGPALRKHGIVVLPTVAAVVSEHYTTAKGTPMKGVTATVTFRFYGPAGDFIEAQACGESSDSGDKAVPKAHSVAYRTMLLQALCIPTDEPDPDTESHERGETRTHDAHGYAESRADAPGPVVNGDPGTVTLSFGKHRGKAIRDVPAEYLTWWLAQDTPKTDDLRHQRAAAEMFVLGVEGVAVPVGGGEFSDDDVPF